MKKDLTSNFYLGKIITLIYIKQVNIFLLGNPCAEQLEHPYYEWKGIYLHISWR